MCNVCSLGTFQSSAAMIVGSRVNFPHSTVTRTSTLLLLARMVASWKKDLCSFDGLK
jgi:hypothetical protein